jgi:transcriptional regulator with XRE-family HTH domain
VTDEQPEAVSLVNLADEAFGHRVRLLREQEGITLAALCERMKAVGVEYMNPSTLSRIETGKRPARLAEAFALARLFGVSLELMDPAHDDLRSAQTYVRSTLNSFYAIRRTIGNLAMGQERLREIRATLVENMHGQLSEAEREAYGEILKQVDMALALDVSDLVGKKRVSRGKR